MKQWAVFVHILSECVDRFLQLSWGVTFLLTQQDRLYRQAVQIANLGHLRTAARYNGRSQEGYQTMTATLIDGKAVAARIRAEIAEKVQSMYRRPGLAAVLVGDNPASHTYVKMKRKACAEVGIESLGFELPADSTQEAVENLVRDLNARSLINGILVQLPLPAHLDEARILSAVSLEKDVDGFHPINIGRLAQKGREPLFVSATPAGALRLLDETGVKLAGANAVVL